MHDKAPTCEQPHRSSARAAPNPAYDSPPKSKKTLLRSVRVHGSPRDRALLSLALGTGLRLRELRGLNVGNVSADGAVLFQDPLSVVCSAAAEPVADLNRRRHRGRGAAIPGRGPDRGGASHRTSARRGIPANACDSDGARS